MKLHFKIYLLYAFAVAGCASCEPQQTFSSGMASPMVTPQASAAEACPALSMGWKTVSLKIPVPQLLAVPKPQRGPQVVGIPIMAAAAPMAVAQPMAAPQTLPVQTQYVPVQPQGTAEPQGSPQPQEAAPKSIPGCGEGCNSQTQIMHECDALMQDIGRLQQQISIQAGDGKASLNAVK